LLDKENGGNQAHPGWSGAVAVIAMVNEQGRRTLS
jgi:hypothetical protein